MVWTGLGWWFGYMWIQKQGMLTHPLLYSGSGLLPVLVVEVSEQDTVEYHCYVVYGHGAEYGCEVP